MALINPFKKKPTGSGGGTTGNQNNPFTASPAPVAAAQSTNTNNGGGGNKPKKKQKPGQADDAAAATTPPPLDPDDPQAWIRGQLANLGYAPEGDLGSFLDTRVINPFVSGYDSWKALNTTGTFQDYIAQQYLQPGGLGAYVQGLEAEYMPMAASDPGAWMMGKMRAAGINLSGKDDAFNGYLNDQIVSPFTQRWAEYQAAVPDAGFGNFVTHHRQPWGDINSPTWNAYLQQQLSQYTPYSAGKERGGTRWSVY
jgi:hypothetical protein